MSDLLLIRGPTDELRSLANRLGDAGRETTLISDVGGGSGLATVRHAYVSVARCVTPILWVRRDASLAYANPAACRMLGYGPDEIRGVKVADFDPSWTAEFWEREGYPSIRDAGIRTFESTVRRATDGRTFPIEVTANHVEIDGEPLVFAFVVEITERKEREEALARAMDVIAELKDQLQAENSYLREEMKSVHGFDEIVGGSEALRAVLRQVEQVAVTDATVLLLGETGTGKELLARAIHDRSGRARGMLVRVNCATLPASLIESELFGHEKGAFTGAVSRREGRFALADGGTIFLDEIGDLPLELQAKLLRVLQDGEFHPLGSERVRRADVRVVAATNRDLEAAVRAGEFRDDLYFRLTVFPIRVPPLRERVEDIPLLAWAFVRRNERDLAKRIESIPARVMKRLQAYPWPGNVRELQNVIQRSMILTTGPSLQLPELGPRGGEPSGHRATSQSLADVEREHVRRVLDACGWRIKGPGGAAERLGLPPSTLRYRLKKLGLTRTPEVQ